MARLVGLLAVSSRQMLHVEIGGYDDGERSLLLRCLGVLSCTDLLVLDRGYPAWWLFALFGQRGFAFCARLENCGCAQTEVAAFLRSGQSEQIIERRLSAKALGQLKDAGGQPQAGLTVRLRLVRVVLPSGRIEVLITSLLDMATCPGGEFGTLYRQRWSIEEAFKVHVHGVPKAATPAIGARDVSREVSVAS